MARYRNKKAQVTIEYAMVAICVVAALLMMQHYIRRAAQGRLREAADSIGGQYDPKHIDSKITFTQKGTTTIDARQDEVDSKEAEEGRIFGVKTTTTTTGEEVGRTGYEKLEEFPEELFD